jgi:tetratricopeptide (TPR) repeat protein
MIALLIIGALVIAAVAAFLVLRTDRKDVYQRALNMAAEGNFVDARGLIRARIESQPDNPLGHFTMARIYALEGKTGDEKQHLLQVRRINQYGADIHPTAVLNRLGDISYSEGDYRASMDAYLACLQFSPQNEEALARVAFMAAGRGKFEIADRFFRTLSRTAPNTPDYRVGRGIMLSMLKQKEALREFETAVALAPNNPMPLFLHAFQAYKQRDYEKSRDSLRQLQGMQLDPYVQHVANKLGAVVHYHLKEYPEAVASAERCLTTASQNSLKREEYDAHLSVALLSILSGNLEKANDHLIELEMGNPSDVLVQRLSDFRMDLEEGAASLDRVSPRGFDMNNQLQDWLRNRFPDDAIFQLSGVAMEEDFAIDDFFTQEGEVQTRKVESTIDPALMIDRFNTLTEQPFLNTCAKIIGVQGYVLEKTLPYREKDGGDFVAAAKNDRKVKVLFRIRKWKNQPISDIFLREMQNYMNELKVSQGFVVAGARLTPGAESALQNLKRITVIQEYDFAELLIKVLGQ